MVDRAQTSSHRQRWAQLPSATRATVEALTGPVTRADSVVAGFSSHLAEVIDTPSGRIFVKGIPTDDPEVWSQHREAELSRYVWPIGPRLRWQVASGGWNLLGFDHLEGHLADYRSPADLTATAAAMAELGRLACPPEVELKDAVARWGRYLHDPAEIALLAGDALLHTDWNYSNVIVTPDGSAHLVDWPWATRGQPWIDPCCWIVWLIFAGQSPAEAERCAARVPAWHMAGTRQLSVFAAALAAEWRATAQRRPNVWTHSLRDAAVRWATHRTRA
ncbi:phosphotransferase family protein [Nocardia stercoris]|uniref:Aminoglycoside phosphotransferase n=1 Tax=Nocardia stercoris TaxID=2483361 RepID=A0A3M2L386_9NOCA|nr:aminoglycoside phosphotransferase [Nocardia stercoris]RMI32179.1 aminoglycoside phosphotransferase [Nocardia stercoris]